MNCWHPVVSAVDEPPPPLSSYCSPLLTSSFCLRELTPTHRQSTSNPLSPLSTNQRCSDTLRNCCHSTASAVDKPLLLLLSYHCPNMLLPPPCCYPVLPSCQKIAAAPIISADLLSQKSTAASPSQLLMNHCHHYSLVTTQTNHRCPAVTMLSLLSKNRCLPQVFSHPDYSTPSPTMSTV